MANAKPGDRAKASERRRIVVADDDVLLREGLASLLDRSGTLNFGSTLSERRYLRTVFLDSPVRRDISRIE